MATYDWRSAAASDVGRVRTSNEDSVFTNEAAGVFVVADGMGGHAAGEVASAIASNTIGSSVCLPCRNQEELDRLGDHLVESYLAAGEEISRQVEVDPRRSGMGTTCTVLLLREEGEFLIGNIGDSRAYLLRHDVLRQVTHDHSWVQEQVDRGLITPEQAVGHPQSNIITRALGTDPTPTPDLYSGAIRRGDMFLLASDGLTDMVSNDRISELLRGDDSPEDTVARLITAANEAGGVDNITVLLVTIRELDS